MYSKTDQAYEKIKREIIVGNISNRQPISVNGLSKDLAMSKTPVRDALHRLQTEGFVRIIPNQGIVVQELDVEDVAQMYELRVALDQYLVKKAIPLLTDKHIEDLWAIIEKQRKAMENHDSFEFMKYDHEQHLYLHQIYHNQIFFNVLHRMADRIFYAGVQALRIPERMVAVFMEHKLLVQALEERNVDKFNHALEQHYAHGLRSTRISVEQSSADWSAMK